MRGFDVEVVQELKTRVVFDNGEDANSVLRDICDRCHYGLESASIQRQDAENNPYLNTAKNWAETCEELEGILCHILDLLGD